MQWETIYDPDAAEELLENDGMSPEEHGFLMGYLSDDRGSAA